MCRKILITVILLANVSLFAQPTVPVGKEACIDSLMQIIKQSQDDSTRIQNYLEIVSEIYRDNPATAQEYLDIAASLISLSNHHEFDANLFYFRGKITADLGHQEAAIMWLGKALQASQTQENSRFEGNIYLVRGLLFSRQDNLAKAMGDLIEAEKIFKIAENEKGLGDVHVNMGILYFYQNLLEPAKHYFETALALYEELGEELGQAKCHLNLGVVCKNQDMYDEAIIHYQKSRAYFREKGRKRDELFILNNLGSLELGREKPLDALPFLEEGLELSYVVQNKPLRLSIWINLGEAYHDLKDFSKAIPYFKHAYSLADSLNMDNKKLKIAQELAKSLDSLGQSNMALDWMHTAFALQDTVDKKAEQEELMGMQAKFKMEEQADENDRLKAEQEIQQLRNFAISIGFGFVFILTLILFFNFRRKNKINQLLEEQQQAIGSQNRKLQEQHDRLESLNQEKNMMMGMLAHDIRDPLAKIEGISNILLDQSDLSIQQVSFLGHIRGTAQNLSEMSQRLLNLEALEAGKLPFKLEKIDFAPVIEDSTEAFLELALSKEIRLNLCDIPPNTFVWADKEALQQIAHSLLSNAIESSPLGSEVDICFEETDEEIGIKVTDQGVGINKKENLSLMNEYSNLREQPVGGISTHSLGLALIKKYIDAMNGRIECDSKEGGGTTFSVYLPTSLPASV